MNQNAALEGKLVEPVAREVFGDNLLLKYTRTPV